MKGHRCCVALVWLALGAAAACYVLSTYVITEQPARRLLWVGCLPLIMVSIACEQYVRATRTRINDCMARHPAGKGRPS